MNESRASFIPITTHLRGTQLRVQPATLLAKPQQGDLLKKFKGANVNVAITAGNCCVSVSEQCMQELVAISLSVVRRFCYHVLYLAQRVYLHPTSLGAVELSSVGGCHYVISSRGFQ